MRRYYTGPKAVPLVNPFRKAVKQLRAGGMNKQARALAKLKREADREAYQLTKAAAGAILGGNDDTARTD